MKINLDASAALIGVGLLAAIAAGLYVAKKGVAGAAAGAVGAVGDAAAGTVVGIGQVFGIPATNETECQRAIREGRTWDASFACPAGTFLRSLWGEGVPSTYDTAGLDYDETERLLRRYPPQPEGSW